MGPFPLALSEIFGHWGAYVVFLLIGFGFGYVLEIAGFGNSKKLAAQFYLTDMTVLKVMFSAIIVAMVLIFFTAAVGLLNYNLIWVNPTYLVPGIVGGLLMGVGFIVGGFCPGTSLVAAATAKIDGIFFVLGVFFGIFLFGETVGYYEDFWNSTYMGRFTLPELFNVNTGVVVLGIVLVALFMFWGAEHLERIFGNKPLSEQPRWRYGAAGALAAVAVVVLVIGQPTTADKWARIAPVEQPKLDERAYQIHPGELYDLMDDAKLNVMMLDVRSETDYNQFHILDAQHLPLDEVPAAVPELMKQPANTVFVVMSNGETAATDAWRTLKAEAVPNVYILGGGVNEWIRTFAEDEFKTQHAVLNVPANDDTLMYTFNSALGSRHPAANPHPDLTFEYEKKVELQAKRAPSGGGCG